MANNYDPREDQFNLFFARHPRLTPFAKVGAVLALVWCVGLVPGWDIVGRIALFGLCGGLVLLAWQLGVFAWLLERALWVGGAIADAIGNAAAERRQREETEAFHAKLRRDHYARVDAETAAPEITRADRQTMPSEYAVLKRESRRIHTGRAAPIRETEMRGLFSDVSAPRKRSALENIVRAAGSTWRALMGAKDALKLVGILLVLIALYLIAAPVWRAGAHLVGAMFPHETRQEAIARADRNEVRAQSAENQTHIAVNVAIPEAARTMRVERHVERVENEARERLSSPSVAADPRLLYAEYFRLYQSAWRDSDPADGDSAPRGTGPMRPANPSPGGNASGLAA